mgnify:CR=1 FL=1
MEKNKTCNRPWRYSLAMFGLSIAGYMYVTYGTFFYTETIGLSMKLIALGNVLYAVWDAFNDPIAGYLSDRTRTRWAPGGGCTAASARSRTSGRRWRRCLANPGCW